MRVGQPLEWVDAAGRTAAQRARGADLDSATLHVGAGPLSAERPCWSGLTSRAWRDVERAERHGKVCRASEAGLLLLLERRTSHQPCDACLFVLTLREYGFQARCGRHARELLSGRAP